MNNDVKSGIGYIIPFGAIVGFFTALFLGEYLISIVIAIAGILFWCPVISGSLHGFWCLSKYVGRGRIRI